MTRRFGRPIQRASKADRTYNGRAYASKAERLYAERLDTLVRIGLMFRWLPQPNFHLTPDISFRPDFIVTKATEDSQIVDTWVVDVKGYSQIGWTKKRKLWLKYAPLRMEVVEYKNRSWVTIEIVDPSVVGS